MRPAVPPGYFYTGGAAASSSQQQQGHAVPPRVHLDTVETAFREQAARGGIDEFFVPRLIVTSPSASTFERSQQHLISMRGSSNGDSYVDPSTSALVPASHNSASLSSAASSPSTGIKIASPSVLWEETPIVLVHPPIPPDASKLGGAAASAAGGIQAQRSDFAKMLAACDPNAAPVAVSTPQFPDVSHMAGVISQQRRTVAEQFVERCKGLWEMMMSSHNNGGTNSSAGNAQKKREAALAAAVAKAGIASEGTGATKTQSDVMKLDPLVVTLQVAVLAQDIACSPYVGYAFDLLGGAASINDGRRLRLEHVFTKQEARRQIANTVLLHKLLIATCECLKDSLVVRVEPADLAVLAHFALPDRGAGPDSHRLIELWPSGPLALFPIAAFATFVPIRDAANCTVELSTVSRAEDGDEPTLRIRAVVAAQHSLDGTTKSKSTNSSDDREEAVISAMAASAASGGDPAAAAAAAAQQKAAESLGSVLQIEGQQVRIWKRPLNATVPDEVLQAQAAGRSRDPRAKIARFMSSLMQKRNDPKALEMAMQMAAVKPKEDVGS